ncbi:MAG: SRPBCC family protein [Actinomycetota bacterium]|nr:SRPBCC family protein [Actinomycetota bacterium]
MGGQPIQVRETETFPVSPERGFDYITDRRNWPDYIPGCEQVREGPDARWEPGSPVHVRMAVGGSRPELELRLQEFERGERVRYTTPESGLLPAARHQRLFEPDPAGLRFTIVVEYDARPGPRGLLDRTLVRRGVRRTARKTLENLKTVLSIPPDRTITRHPRTRSGGGAG